MSDAAALIPATVGELRDVLRAANSNRTSVEIVGGGTKAGIGFPGRVTQKISTRKFSQVIDYDAAELVITLGAGVLLADVEALLASHQQMLAFEPFEFASVTSDAARSTIGGVIGAGIAGSRRVSAGNVRDHLLGFTAVSGAGDEFKAGGRVVKNVTGFDVSKLMAGSWGQLAVLTEVTLKVIPRARAAVTLQIAGLTDDRAVAIMSRALRSRESVAAAACIPDADGDRSRVVLRLEGFGPSVDARVRSLRDLMGADTEIESLDESTADEMWSAVRGASALRGGADNTSLWRLCIPASSAVQVMTVTRSWQGQFIVDWGGGLIWAKLPISVAATAVRALAEQAVGHAMLVHAPLEYRVTTSALHPEVPGVAALARRVRAAFDPAGILDPARFAQH